MLTRLSHWLLRVCGRCPRCGGRWDDRMYDGVQFCLACFVQDGVISRKDGVVYQDEEWLGPCNPHGRR